MAARAMWKADLALGEIKVPVKLYSAVQDSKVHFRLLHAQPARAPAARVQGHDALAGKSKKELYEQAKKLDLPGRSSMSREELIAALRKAG